MQLKKKKIDGLISIRIPKSLRHKLFKVAEKSGLTPSAFIRFHIGLILKRGE